MDTPKTTQEMGPESEPALEPSEALESAATGSDLSAGNIDPQVGRNASADEGTDEGDDIVADDPSAAGQVAQILEAAISADEPEPDAVLAAEPEDPGFANLGLAPSVAQAVADLGYETPTPVQRGCIPHLLEGRDLLGQAQTGTGKTAAFALPLLSRIDFAAREPQVLVLTPTRELALQVAEAFQRYAHNLKEFHVLPIYGGQSYGLQVRQLQRVPQVIVGTPGRIMDHMRRNTLSLDGLKALVLDEADEMLNMGFAEDIDWIFEHTPADRQVALFSATMPPEILRVARDHLIDPVEIRIESATATVDTIDQQHCVVTRFHKVDVLTRILELEPFDGMLIFVRTKGGTTELVDKLRSQGFAAEALNGDMSQEMRERTVDRLKGGQLDILVATDVAARGLDVERVNIVINFDIPMDPSGYVHRIGRTGRAGRAGKAILLVEPRERGLLRAIERTIRRPIPEMAPPSAAQLSATRIDRFIEQIRETVAGQDLDFFFRLMARISKEQELEPMNIAAALSFLIQRERPLEVKDPPREPRREYRDDRPRGQDRGRYPDRGTDRGDRRSGGEREGNRPSRDQAGPARPYEPRAPREGGYDRPREGNRDDRPFPATHVRAETGPSARTGMHARPAIGHSGPSQVTNVHSAPSPATSALSARTATATAPHSTPEIRAGTAATGPSALRARVGRTVRATPAAAMTGTPDGTTGATVIPAPHPLTTPPRPVIGTATATASTRRAMHRARASATDPAPPAARAAAPIWSVTASRSDIGTGLHRGRSSGQSPTNRVLKVASSARSISRTTIPSSISLPACRKRSWRT